MINFYYYYNLIFCMHHFLLAMQVVIRGSILYCDTKTYLLIMSLKL